jgi:hypothetical protein
MDSGLVGDNSVYWKLVEEHFNHLYPFASIDGPLWAEKVHFHHLLIANYHEQVCPEDHGIFFFNRPSINVKGVAEGMQQGFHKFQKIRKPQQLFHENCYGSIQEGCR